MEDRYWNQGFMNSYTFGNQLYKRVIFGCCHWKKLSITLFHLYSDSRTIASLQFFSVLWKNIFWSRDTVCLFPRIHLFSWISAIMIMFLQRSAHSWECKHPEIFITYTTSSLDLQRHCTCALWQLIYVAGTPHCRSALFISATQ